MALCSNDLFEVFFRLPAKAIHKFKCVNKLICNLSEETFFTMKQGEHSLKMHDTCFFLQPELSSLMHDLKVELFPLPQNKSSSGVSNDVMNFLSKSTRVLASSKGLILCHTRSNLLSQFFICNPITKSWLPIPSPNQDQVEEEKHEVDPIMVLVECPNGYSQNYMIFYFQGPTDWSSSFPCKFFNSKEGLWQQMEKNFFAGGRNLKFNMPVCCNGAIHFISDCGTYFTRDSKFFMPYIMSYNLESGTTKMLQLPKDATWDFDDDSCDMSIFSWGKSSICLVKLLKSVFTIWILTDYESQNWLRLLMVTTEEISLSEMKPKITAFTVMNSNLLVFATESMIYNYDLSEKNYMKFEEICQHRCQSNKLYFTPYLDSFRVCGPAARSLPC